MHTHVSVTHTPLAAVSIFNKFLNLKNFTPPLLGARFVVSLSLFLKSSNALFVFTLGVTHISLFINKAFTMYL